MVQAAQALEPAALVAMRLVRPGGSVALVGDPKQLPATVLSQAASASHLAQSLFERLQRVRLPCLCRQHNLLFAEHTGKCRFQASTCTQGVRVACVRGAAASSRPMLSGLRSCSHSSEQRMTSMRLGRREACR